MSEELKLRIYGDPALPTVIYLPGLHGDWTLIGSLRKALEGLAHFVEMTYPRTLTWSIGDYATAVQETLLQHGISHGWLLGESFGSQIAWGLIEKNLPSNGQRSFLIDGLILAGGFVKHPLKFGPKALSWIGRLTPAKLFKMEMKIYAWYAKFRHRKAPEVLAEVKEFVNRRTELDREAIRHRLALLDQYDPRTVARQTSVPVYYLAGLVDPLIPHPLVRLWLRKNCPGYRGGRMFWLSDHNVLATAPAKTARVMMQWIGSHSAQRVTAA